MSYSVWYPYAAASLAALAAVLILFKVTRELAYLQTKSLYAKRVGLEERQAGWPPLVLGLGFIGVGSLVATTVEISWLLGAGSYWVWIAAFGYGAYEALRGIGILVFRQAAAGVLVGAGLLVGLGVVMTFYFR